MEHMKSSRRGRMVGVCWSPNTPGSGRTRTQTLSTWPPLLTTASTTSRKEVLEQREENAIRTRKGLMVVICFAVIVDIQQEEKDGRSGANASSIGVVMWNARSVFEMFKYPLVIRNIQQHSKFVLTQCP